RTTHVRRPDRETVHGAVVPRRLVDRRDDRLREHATNGVRQVDVFGGEGGHGVEDPIERLRDGETVGAAGQTGAHAPPPPDAAFADRTSPTRRSARSRSSGVFTFMKRTAGSPYPSTSDSGIRWTRTASKKLMTWRSPRPIAASIAGMHATPYQAHSG